MKFTYKVGNENFKNKLLAIKNSNDSKKPITFNCPKEYESFDFSTEPDKSLQSLLHEQALKYRESYKKIRLYFSGGSDSMLMLKTFVDNNIYIDEIVCLKSGIKDADFEIDNFAIPMLNSLDLRHTKVTINAPTLNDYVNYYSKGVTEERIKQGNFCYHTFIRLHWQTEMFKKENYDPNTANLRGFDKSMVLSKDGYWYTYFVDCNLETFDHMHNFFSDDPAIQCKQAHLWKKVVETMSHKQKEKSYSYTDKEIQIMWNKTLGRNFKTSAPLKDLFSSKEENYIKIDNKKCYFVNLKEKYAINYLSKQNKELLFLWQKNLQGIAEYTGKHWWNEQSPEMGTVGVLSKFYCLTKNQTKTVDELYPNGFKP